MEVTNINLEGVKVISPAVFHDERGYFFESYQKEKWQLDTEFVQDNEAFSRKGILRGLHYQLPPFAQSKLVRVIQGEVLDVIVDIRPQSATYGQHFSIVLSSTNFKQLFVPRGFAHGYVVLTETAVFAYKCDGYYHKGSEAGIRYDDPLLNIDWILPANALLLSEKDMSLPYFGAHQIFE